MLRCLPFLFWCLVLSSYSQAQNLGGTWLISYQRDEPANKRTFFYRLYIQENKDSFYGVGEAFGANTDVLYGAFSDANAVARFTFTGKQNKSEDDRFEVIAGPLTVLSSGTTNQPPFFLQFSLQIVETMPRVATTLVSAVPFSDGTIGNAKAVKVSEDIVDFDATDDEGNPLKIAIRWPVKSRIKTAMQEPEQVVVRKEEVQHRMQVAVTQVSIDIYDNGIVDDDTISLYLNDELVINKQRVSNRPLHLNVLLKKGRNNKLVLYAHNLGTIPPNTALMILTAGGKRHELRLASSLSKNATALISVKE